MSKDTLRHTDEAGGKVSHFLGAVVRHQFSENTNYGCYIVDGQQRIMTTSLMIVAWIDALLEVYGPEELEEHTGDIISLLKALFREFSTLNGLELSKLPIIQPISRDASLYYEVLFHVTSKLWKNGLTKNVFSEYDEQMAQLEEVSFRDWNSPQPDKDKPKSEHDLSLRPKDWVKEDERRGVDWAFVYLQEHLVQFAREISKEYRASEVIKATIDVLLESFKFVTITVTHEERPQEIFESLNARSVALTCFDLIKNYVLMSIDTKSASEMDDFYTQNWEHFETDSFWISLLKDPNGKYLSKGKLKKADQRTIFLNYWLEANVLNDISEQNLAEYVAKREAKDVDNRFATDDDIFWAYRRELQGKTASEVQDINLRMSNDSRLFQQISQAIQEDVSAISEEASGRAEFESMNSYPELKAICNSHNVPQILHFADRCIHRIGYYSLWKILLWVIRESSLTSVQNQAILEIVESWVLRREVAGYSKANTEKGINNILAYLNYMTEKTLTPTVRIENSLIDYLKSQDKISLQWPTDSIMNEKTPHNSKMADELIKLVLMAVEDYERGFTSLSSPSRLPGVYRTNAGSVHINKIIPEAREKSYDWHETSSLPTEQDKILRQSLITSQIGNYVLLPISLPVFEKGYSWLERKTVINRASTENTTFRYNKNLIDGKNWDNITITQNTKELIAIFNKLWVVLPHKTSLNP